MKINTEKCEKCSGRGYIFETTITLVNRIPEYKAFDYRICPTCRGTGKTDWVRRITGSYSDYIPDIGELTAEVCEATRSGKIYGLEEILIENNRRYCLREKEDENKQ
jgi:RecJ-like exonuclease